MKFHFSFVVSLIILFLASLPFIFGIAYGQRNGVTYTGGHVLTPGDYPVYLQYFQQAKAGATSFDNLYTHEQFPKIVNVFWMAAAKISTVLSFPPAIGFHVFRLVFSVAFLFVMIRFFRKIFPNHGLRRLAFAMLFAGGFGAYTSPLFSKTMTAAGYLHQPPDLWMPEAFGFLLLMNIPHIIASVTLMVCAFWQFISAIETKKIRHAIGFGLCQLLLFQFHPFHIPTVFTIQLVSLIVWWASRRRVAKHEIFFPIIGWAIAAPSIAYHGMLLTRYEVVRERSLQNLNITMLPHVLIAGFGFLFVLGFLGFWMKRKTLRGSFLWTVMGTWLVVQPFLFYSPLDWNRRLTQGWFIPLAVFSAYALDYGLRQFRKAFPENFSRRLLLAIFAIILVYMTPLYVVVYDIAYLKVISEHPNEGAMYLRPSEIDVLNTIHDKSNRNTVILADLRLSNIIPAWIGHRVFIGHGVETLRYEEKLIESQAFYKLKRSKQINIEWLLRNNISFVIFSKQKNRDHNLVGERKGIVWENEDFILLQTDLLTPP